MSESRRVLAGRRPRAVGIVTKVARGRGAPAMVRRGAPTSGSCRGTGTLTRGHPLSLPTIQKREERISIASVKGVNRAILDRRAKLASELSRRA